MSERIDAPIPVILDVDTGTDDALAIIVAVRHPRLLLKAVTCVGGNVPLDQVVENTLGVLALAGARDVPVAAGMRAPLIAPSQGATEVHGRNGIADFVLPAHGLSVERPHAVELLRELLEVSDEKITIVALAPMTNLAVLLRMYPSAADSIERVVFMGGAIGRGNATEHAEFNVWHDPEATDIVLRSGVPLTMYGLEPFYRVVCDRRSIAVLAGAPDPVSSFVGHLLTHLAVVSEDEDRIQEFGSAAIGDAGTVCAVIDPDGADTSRARVRVALHDPVTRGKTLIEPVAGGASSGSAGGAVVDVVIDVDAERFARLFLGAVSSAPDGVGPAGIEPTTSTV